MIQSAAVALAFAFQLVQYGNLMDLSGFRFELCDSALQARPGNRSTGYGAWCVMQLVDRPVNYDELCKPPEGTIPLLYSERVLPTITELKAVLDTPAAAAVFGGSWSLGRPVSDDNCLSVGIAEAYVGCAGILRRAGVVSATTGKGLPREASELLNRYLRSRRLPTPFEKALAWMGLAFADAHADREKLPEMVRRFRVAARVAAGCHAVALTAECHVVELFNEEGSTAASSREVTLALKRFGCESDLGNYIWLQSGQAKPPVPQY